MTKLGSHLRGEESVVGEILETWSDEMIREARKRSEHSVQVSSRGVRAPDASDFCEECMSGWLVGKVRELLRYHLKPLQVGRVVSKQADQINPRLQPSATSHAAEESTPRTKLSKFWTERLPQNSVDWKVGEVHRPLGGDPRNRSDLVTGSHDEVTFPFFGFSHGAPNAMALTRGATR